MRALTLSLIQAPTRWHDPPANRELFSRWFGEVPDQADIVVLPEMFSTGFTMNSHEVAEPMSGPTLSWMIEAAASLDKVICGSLVINEEGAIYNRFVWVTPDGVRATYDKRHLFRMAGEHEHYAAGSRRLTIDCNGWKLCPFICYDLRFPVFLRNRGDYDLLLGVANWPAARQLAWDTLLRARAIENLSFVAAVNVTGTDGNGVEYAGGSIAVGPEGERRMSAGGAEGVHTIRFEHAQLAEYRQKFPAWQDADGFELEMEI